MDVAELMTSYPVSVAPRTSLREAMALMDEHDVRHLPVLQDERLVGLVSDRDLLTATGWLTPADAGEHPGAEHLSDVMHTDLTLVGPDDTVVTAAVAFTVQRIGCLPVLENGRLVGILTEIDMLMAYWRMCHDGLVDGDVDPVIATLMSTRMWTVAPATFVSEAAAIAREHGVHHLPVVDDGRLVGILSDRDLRAAVGTGHELDATAPSMMTTDPVTLDSQARLSQAAELMASYKISGLPVVDEGRMVGIVTLTDLLAHCVDTLRETEAARR